MSQIYLLGAMQGFRKTGMGMCDHDPCYLACVAAGPRTRLNHLYSPLYTEA